MNTLGKPIAEKLCHDWNNSNIKQLKLLLGKEFHQPNSKLQKPTTWRCQIPKYSRASAKSLQQDIREGDACCLRRSSAIPESPFSKHRNLAEAVLLFPEVTSGA